MKYIIAILLLALTTGCSAFNANIRSARVNVLTAKPTSEAIDTVFMNAEVTPEAEICTTVIEEESWDLPPFAWPPRACSEHAHVKMWPDYADILETECTWFFYPYEKNLAGCKSTWAYEYGSWIMKTISCMELRKNSIQLRQGTLKNAMEDRAQKTR